MSKNYPQIPDFHKLVDEFSEYIRLKHEYGAGNIEETIKSAEILLEQFIEKVKALENDKILERKEPDGYNEIQALCPKGHSRLWDKFKDEEYEDKLKGALYARLAGCILGSIVEFWPINEMKEWAEQIGDEFPPVDYWSKAKNEDLVRYNISKCKEYTRASMNGVAADDDIIYTLLGLLIAEDYGVDFSVEDVGEAWLKYLPYACTAEDVALRNLKNGIPAKDAADIGNPYCQWIGADIRSDSWAYMAPGYPEKAAEMAYNDAYISHRRNGIYGEMFFSAAQSAAFAVNDPLEAIRIGLTEIPAECSLAKDVKWALEKAPRIKDYRQAREAVDEYFKGMSAVHANNNACLTIFGLAIGGTDVTKVISQTVAMGMDNDCTAATAGSIVGSVAGFQNIPKHWYRNFNNKIYSYLNGHEEFEIDDVLKRFKKQATKVFNK